MSFATNVSHQADSSQEEISYHLEQIRYHNDAACKAGFELRNHLMKIDDHLFQIEYIKLR